MSNFLLRCVRNRIASKSIEAKYERLQSVVARLVDTCKNAIRHIEEDDDLSRADRAMSDELMAAIRFAETEGVEKAAPYVCDSLDALLKAMENADVAGRSLYQSPVGLAARAALEHWRRSVKVHFAVVDALSYPLEKVDLTSSRFNQADDNDTAKIEVTIGWLRDVRDALALTGIRP